MMTNTPAAIHPFEVAGLGRAPFRCIDVVERTYVACQGATVQPGGSCAFCGQGIKTCCVIKSADGRKFDVGSDCVAQLAKDCARTDNERAARALVDAANAIKTRKANARKDVAIEAARETFAANRETLDGMIWDGVVKHSHGPRSVGAQLEWMFSNGGRTLKMRAVKILAALLVTK